MRRLLGLLIKDFKVAYRNFFLLIVIVVAGLLILITNFLIPEKVNLDSKVLFAVEGQEEETLRGTAGYLESQSGSRRLSDRNEITQGMKADKNTVGLLLKESGGKPEIEIILQGFENERSRNALALTLESILNAGQISSENIEVITLKTDGSHEKISFNKSFVPLMILNEPIMLGFIFIATLIFIEKEEGTIKAYMVTPGGLAVYLWSKILLMMGLSLLSTVLITIFTAGLNVNWLLLLIITIAGSLFSSTVAMFIASFFDNISQAMIWILGISLLFTAPIVSYFIPSFAPRFVTQIPTYQLMFALREAIFPSGGLGLVYRSIISLIIMSAILFALSLISYRRSLLQD